MKNLEAVGAVWNEDKLIKHFKQTIEKLPYTINLLPTYNEELDQYEATITLRIGNTSVILQQFWNEWITLNN